MESVLTLKNAQRAFEVRDPDLARLVIAIAEDRQGDTPKSPVRDGALTLLKVQAELSSPGFRRKSVEAQIDERRALIKALELPEAEVPPPERLKLHGLILELWEEGSAYARDQLLQIIAQIPLRWGPWRALKHIFKEAEERQDLEIFGALAARFDVAFAQRGHSGEISRRTLGYLLRRAWRSLRRMAEGLPVAYADAAAEVLRFYPEQVNWNRTWICNHIFYHGTGKYTRRRFSWWRCPRDQLKNRAYAELWRRSPRPLFSLLERAQSKHVRRFAVEALKADFRAQLREVEPAWVARLLHIESDILHDFLIWLLDNQPKLEQGAYRELNLQVPVLRLLSSPSSDARAWAAAYARAHARDMPLSTLIRLANNSSEAVRKMSRDLLQDRHPRKEVGLEAWGRLLGTQHGHELATAALSKHFGARELNPAWFKERLRSLEYRVLRFAMELLPRLHRDKKLGVSFYMELLDTPKLSHHTAKFALDALRRFPSAQIEAGFIRRNLLNPNCKQRIQVWIEEEWLKASELGVEYLKILADDIAFESSALILELRASPRKWGQELKFDESLSKVALELLSDVRKFSPEEISFDWLMQLVQRAEPRYQEFAREYMTRAYIPADFAPKEELTAQGKTSAPEREVEVDLEGKSFLFTGKMSTMTRSQASRKGTAANGKNSRSVTGKLDYLVIGDEGSSFYGSGRKGSKQLKAERLVAKGAPLRIISETAFLQMLAGESREANLGAQEAGSEQLWEMLSKPGPEEAPLAHFARHYIRRHHEEICPDETDRYVDPGAEISKEFLSFERCRLLLMDSRPRNRALGLLLFRYELKRWAPPMEAIVELSEQPYPEVRALIALALTAEDLPEHRRYRLDPERLTPDAVYRFCESLDTPTRALGMRLIALHPRLAIPEELFRLTESPDRNVRSFVIRQLWSLYRERGITQNWKPTPAPESQLKRRGKRHIELEPPEIQGAPPRPENPPAQPEGLRSFLRQTLFGISPTRLPKRRSGGRRLKPLSARKAKLALMELIRDLALENLEFARLILPQFQEFSRAKGQSEMAASLVAIRRIFKAHPQLKESR